MAEKSQNADSGKEIKEKKKRQHNNRKVFRLCRQTLIRRCEHVCYMPFTPKIRYKNLVSHECRNCEITKDG